MEAVIQERGAQEYISKGFARVRPRGAGSAPPGQQKDKVFLEFRYHRRCAARGRAGAAASCPNVDGVWWRGGEERGDGITLNGAWRGRGGWWDLQSCPRRRGGRLTANRQATDSRTRRAQSRGKVRHDQSRSQECSKMVPNTPEGSSDWFSSWKASAGEEEKKRRDVQEGGVAGALHPYANAQGRSANAERAEKEGGSPGRERDI